MFEVLVTKYNDREGTEVTLYCDVNKYRTTENYLILERKSIDSIVYIRKDQVLEFEVRRLNE